MMIPLITIGVLLGALYLVGLDRLQPYPSGSREEAGLKKVRAFIIQYAPRIFGGGATILLIHLWFKVIGVRDVPWGYVWFWTFAWTVGCIVMYAYVHRLGTKTQKEVGQLVTDLAYHFARIARTLSTDSRGSMVALILAVFCTYMLWLQGFPNWGPDLPEVKSMITQQIEEVSQSWPVQNVIGAVNMLTGRGGIPAVERAMGQQVKKPVARVARSAAPLLPRYQRTWVWFFLTPLFWFIGISGMAWSHSDELAYWIGRIIAYLFKDEIDRRVSSRDEPQPEAKPSHSKHPEQPTLWTRILDEVLGGFIVHFAEAGVRAARRDAGV